MQSEQLLDEIVEQAYREFKDVVDQVSQGGLERLATLEADVLKGLLHFGSAIISKILQAKTEDEAESCACLHCLGPTQSLARRNRGARSLTGAIRYERRVFRCPACHCLISPMDRALGLAKGESLTAHAKQEVARLSGRMDFEAVVQTLRDLTGLELTDGGARRVAQTIGKRVADARESVSSGGPLPAVKDAPDVLVLEADGVHGRFDESDPWHEVMVGVVGSCVVDEGEARVVRREVVTIPRNRPVFWKCFEDAAIRNGLFASKRVLFIADAGGGNFDAVTRFAPHAIQILNFYHAAQHLKTALDLIDEGKSDKRFEGQRRCLLAHDGVRHVISNLERLAGRASAALAPDKRKKLATEIEYFRKNRQRMRYAYFRKQGWPIGSGAVEGACKSVFQERFKQSGMAWTTQGMRAIAALRDADQSNSWTHVVSPRLAA